MTPMPIATPAEADVRPARGRNSDRTLSDASGFENAFRSLAEDDAKTADAAVETSEDTDDAEPGTDAVTREGEAKADPRAALLTLLSPLGREATGRAETADKSAGATRSMPSAADGIEGIEADGETRTAALRIAVVRRETHFEPTIHAPVAGDAADAKGADATVASTTKGLSELLDARLVRRGASSGDATNSPKATASLATIAGDMRGLRALANIDVSASKTDAAKENGGSEIDATADADADAAGLSTFANDARFDRRANALAANSRVSSASRETERQTATLGTGSATTAMPSVATQVASTVIEALPDALRPAAPEAPRGGSAFAPAEGGLRLRAGGAALKTLTIQLQPEHLGTLDVTMRLTDGKLALELAADKVETARMLTADRAGLRSLLEKAGFSIEDAAISVVAREALPVSSTRALDQAPGQGDRSGADTRRDAQSQAGSGGRGDGGGAGRDQRHAQPEIADRKPRSGSVFL